MLKHGITLRNPTAALVVAIALSAGACSSESGGSETLTYTTFNVGLAYGFVPLAKERQQAVVDAVKNSKDDVLCLQEVWTDADLKAIDTAAASAGFATSYHHETPEDTAGLPVACTTGDVEDLLPCAKKECGAIDKGALAGCVTTKCAKEFAAVSPTCTTCLASNIGKELDEIIHTCTKGGGKFSYGGYNGLMLLTRKKAIKTDHTQLLSSLVRRSLLHAAFRVGEGDNTATINAYCTHLTASLSAIAYAGEFKTYEEEQAQQVDAVIKAAAGNFVVLGDMNTGKAVGAKIKAELPANFKKFEEAGWKAPYLDIKPEPGCTYCGDNNLVSSGADKGGEGAVIDHVLFSPHFSGFSAKRSHDQEIEIDVAGAKQKSSVSDHFGVTVEAVVTWSGE